jgi:quinol monooxygenase YgiN
MIYVIATFDLHPGTREQTIAAAMPCVVETNKEPGCVLYELHASAVNPDRLVMVEKWETRAHLQAHMGTPHVAAWRKAGGGFIARRTVEIVHAGEVETL